MRIPSIVFLTVILLAMPAPSRIASPFFSGGRGGDARGGRGLFAMVLIDTDGLACSPCLSSLLEFCQAVPPDVQEERIVGVLTFRDGLEPDPRRARIARTRWTGYSRANDIRFPVAVDETHAFNRLSEEGTTVLLFDPSTGYLRRWTAPFPPGAVREMTRYLLTPESPIMESRP